MTDSSKKFALPKFISILFLLSGITGLVYEVLWAKYISLFLGNTGQAHTVVLATFMGGLALGNALLGRLADRVREPLRLYGWLELGIGLLAATSPMLLSLLSDAYIYLARAGIIHPFATLPRLILSMCVLLLPAMLMGGTLPALSRFATHSLNQMEKTVSWFYALNSAGAVLGALLAGFYLIPAWGLGLSIVSTAALNIAIGIVAIYLCVRETSPEPLLATEASNLPEDSTQPPLRPLHVQLMYWGVFISGFCALAYEVAWIRLLALVLGSSTYSFSVMLAAFIAGIAFGSMLVARRILPGINSYLLFGLAELALGVFVIFTVPFYDKLPYVFMTASAMLNHMPATFYALELFKFLLCFYLMQLPTIALGMTLPLATRAITANVGQVGKNVGNIFSMNTLGNVLGAVTAGLFLLPRFGIKGIVDVGIAANLVLGAAVVATASGWNWKKKTAAISLCALAFLVYTQSVHALDKRMLSCGGFRLRFAQALSYK